MSTKVASERGPIILRFEPASLAGPLSGVAQFVANLILDRPSVKVLWRVVDRGPAVVSGETYIYVATRSGVQVELEVHSTGRQPVQPTEVGLFFDNGARIEVTGGDRLPAILVRPAFLTRYDNLDSLRQRARDAGARRIKGAYVKATPRREYRGSSPAEWRRFPEADPPITD